MPAHTNCAGVTRRDCLQLGLGTLLGGGLAAALRAQHAGPGAGGLPARAKACILIWQDGGPTHYEMFDPKPNAPSELRGEFRAIPTAVPGVLYSEHMTITTQNGVVTLEGIVGDTGEMFRILRLCRKIPGARRVVNALEMMHNDPDGG